MDLKLSNIIRDYDSDFGLLISCLVIFFGPKALLLILDLKSGSSLAVGVAPIDCIGGDVPYEDGCEMGESDLLPFP